MQVTAGGNQLEYKGNTSAETDSMITTKFLPNSMVSTSEVQLMTLNIKDFYYGTALYKYTYLRMAMAKILQEII